MAELQLQGFPDNLRAQTVTIASGAASSEIVPTQGELLVGIFMSAAWTAADLGFRVGLEQREAAMKDISASAVTVAAEADRFIPMPTPETYIAPFIQIRSVTAGTYTGVNQGAARELTLLFSKSTR